MRHPLAERGLPLLGVLLLLSCVALGAGLLIGSADIPVARVATLLFANDGSVHDRIVDELRLPRVLSAYAVGGILALAGALMQVLLRNPLGDPYVLGVSGGAAAAVLAAMLLALPVAWQPALAFGGALASTLLVFALAGRGGRAGGERLLLTGIVMAAGWSALISFVLSLSPPVRLPGMLFWLMGDLGDAYRPALPLSVLAVGLLLAMRWGRELNLASHGWDQAQTLGIDPTGLRRRLYFLASALTATAVSIAGAIGFIGLVTPHLVRLLGIRDHRLLLPAAAMLGGSLLLAADTAARTVLSPMQLPVGVLTALFGVPVFLYLLVRRA